MLGFILRFVLFFLLVSLTVVGYEIAYEVFAVRQCLCCNKVTTEKAYCGQCFMRSDMIDALDTQITSVYRHVDSFDRCVLNTPTEEEVEEASKFAAEKKLLLEDVRKTVAGLEMVGVESKLDTLAKSIEELEEVTTKWQSKLEREDAIDRLIQADQEWR